jgi:hypothetical protein
MTNVLGVGSYNTGEAVWAGFILSSSPPEPVTIGGTVTDLEGSGLVLRNDGDEESIVADGPFEFPTPMTPDDWYNVTVATQPTHPAQTCSVENGSGLVPETDVTNVTVTCAEPVLTNLVTVATEGETLPDNTVLSTIHVSGGVGINLDGVVAFIGVDDDGNDAVFAQTGKVVAEGETLDDGTRMYALNTQAEVAIGAGLGSETVAFQGLVVTSGIPRDEVTIAVFTQSGKVAEMGDEISPGVTLDLIDPLGTGAINYWEEVAFHGSLSPSSTRAVFIADGENTLVVAQEGTNLSDNTFLNSITPSGGVAISFMGDVAFHGGTSTTKAVFTQNGPVARVGANVIVPGGTTSRLDHIYDDAGVAINLFGSVVFHGRTDGVHAVLIADGETIQVVAKVGDVLPDDTTVLLIDMHGGVAINMFGDVVFHGRGIGGQGESDFAAVFTQKGVVAKEGSNVDDGTTTLSDIFSSGGVAIDPFGDRVAFLGYVDDPDHPGSLFRAVVVGLVPVVE